MIQTEPIPLFDTRAEYAEIKDEIHEAIERVLSSGRFVGGPEVAAFENEFAQLVAGRGVAAVNSGTDALRLGLMALGVGPGDEVVIPANTFSATAMAVEHTGATPVVADVDPATYVMTRETVEPLITDQTRCIVPVHLFGHLAPMADLRDLASRYGLLLLEDAAQAHGAEKKGLPSGGWGDAAAFSFYVSKNLGAYGDGGAVVGDGGLIAEVRMLRDLGRNDAGEHIAVGFNSRLDALQAAVLRVKLRHFPDWSRHRRERARRYNELLGDLDVTLPIEVDEGAHVYHLYVVRVRDRDRIAEGLRIRGIETGVHYRTPIHLQPAHLRRVKVPSGARVAEELAGEVLSLPIYPQMTDAQQTRIAESLRELLTDQSRTTSR